MFKVPIFFNFSQNIFSIFQMVYFIIGVCLSVSLFVIFRGFNQFKVNMLQAIVSNYFVCIITGFIFIGDFGVISKISLDKTWVQIAMGMGFVFIATFYLMGYTAQKVSVTASSLSSKISLIIPVLFSLLYLNTTQDFGVFRYIGLILVFGAIILTSIKKKQASLQENVESHQQQINDSISPKQAFLLSFLVFILSGFIDLMMNLVNTKFITDTTEKALFTIVIFSVAAVIGIVVLLIKKEKFELKSLLGGIILGVPNFFSIYFMFRALDSFNGNGAIFFPLFNISVIIVSSVASVIIFREKLNKFNIIGLLMAVLAIVFISFDELKAFFG